jgi:hypothetical protein
MLTVSTIKVLQEGLFRAHVDLIDKRKNKLKTPNAFLQELAMLNPNATFEDLATELKRDISVSSSLLLAYINKMGYKLVPKDD